MRQPAMVHQKRPDLHQHKPIPKLGKSDIPKPQAALKPQIKHFSDHQEEMKSDPTKPKQVRVSKEPMNKQLEKIAKNTAHPEETKAERSLRSFEHMKQR